jgi:hypothetical protein
VAGFEAFLTIDGGVGGWYMDLDGLEVKRRRILQGGQDLRGVARDGIGETSS